MNVTDRLFHKPGLNPKRATVFGREAGVLGRVSQRGTRQDDQLRFPKKRLKIGRKTFAYYAY